MKNVLSLVGAASRRKHVSRKGYVNREGARSFPRDLREQVVDILTTGTLGSTFYASKEQIASEALEVLIRARNENPEFLARALVYARNEGFMKTLPVLGLVALSGSRTSRAAFEAVFDRVILIPDDLRLFVALCRKGSIPGRKGLGGIAALAVKRWLGKMSEYHSVKYGSAVSAEVTLADIVRLSHPRPADAAASERFAWLASGESGLSSNASLNPQIRMLEILKSMPTLEAQLAVVKNSNLPYEVVVPSMKETNTEVWTALFDRAPYLNLLRNLVTFTRHGVFADQRKVGNAVARLTNRSAIERSKVLPFRFFDAWKKYTDTDGHDNRIADALRKALELSFVNLPSFGDRSVAIGSDVSGSMGTLVSDKGTARYIDIAGIFTGALLKRIENRAICLPFDGAVRSDLRLSGRDDILVTTDKMAKAFGGSTAVGAPIEYLLNRKIGVDVFVGITDNVDWAHGDGYHCSASFLTLWRRYRKEVAPRCRAYLVTIAPYREAVAPSGEPGVCFIYGWSNRVLSYIALNAESGANQISAIEQMELAPANPDGGLDESEDAQTED